MSETPKIIEQANTEIVVEEIEHFDTNEIMAPANSRCS